MGLEAKVRPLAKVGSVRARMLWCGTNRRLRRRARTTTTAPRRNTAFRAQGRHEAKQAMQPAQRGAMRPVETRIMAPVETGNVAPVETGITVSVETRSGPVARILFTLRPHPGA